MRDDDRELVEKLRATGDKPCIALAAFFEDAYARPEKVLAAKREAEARLSGESLGDLEVLLANAREMGRDMLLDVAAGAARGAGAATPMSAEAIIEEAERLLYER